MRGALAALVLGPLMLTGLGTADVAAFNWRASSLEASWQADESAGVTHAQLAPARAAVAQQRDRRVAGFLPYAILSGAIFRDPFTWAESLAAGGHAQALAANRNRAEKALARLKQLGGPNYDALPARTSALAAARRPAEYLRLATAWEAEGDQLQNLRTQLSSAAGGLTDDGQPKDVADGVARLQAVISAATQASLSTDPGRQALSRAQAYLKVPYAAQLQQHAEVAAAVKSAIDTVQGRIDVRAQLDSLVGQLPDLLAAAQKYGISGSYASRASQVKTDAQSAEAAGDDAKMAAAAGEARQLVNELSGLVSAARKRASDAALASGTGCLDGYPTKLIVVHLATQKLVAYDNECPLLTSLVTTGRPELRTDRGTFHIYAKYPTYHMISPWPEGSPLWYHDAWVNDAMEFVSDGTFLHGASWEPLSAYGPGSEDGPYASHGCVHVPDGPLATLYNWAPIGTTVIVMD